MKRAQTFLLSCIISLGLANAALAQNPLPAPGTVYNDAGVLRIDLLIDPDSLDVLLAPGNELSDHHFPATFIFSNGQFTDTVEEVGLRLRGNTSRYSQKKSFRVSFNTFRRGRDWQGLEKMNLNGEHNDPTIARAKLSWDLMQQARVPAPRANHAELYFNGAYRGLYVNVEHIDEKFTQLRYGNQDGNLYKCLYPADLNYLGANPNNYKMMAANRRVYELKNNTGDDDYSDLAHFIDILNNEPLATLPCELEAVFNVDSYLRAMAMDIITANWDGPIFNKNNFYLYHNLATGQFEYIPYDLDNTYGIDWFGIDWATRNLYNWSHPSEARPIYTRILAIQEYRRRFSYYFDQLLQSALDPLTLFPRIDSLRLQLAPHAAPDLFRTLDYGYTLTDFHNAYTQPLWGHVVYGLTGYLATRRNSALSQLQVVDIFPVLRELRHAQGGPGDSIGIFVQIEDEDTAPAVTAYYREAGGPEMSIALYDDGAHQDGAAGDGLWGGSFQPGIGTGTIEYYVRAIDNAGHNSRSPRCGYRTLFLDPELPALRINEFMASNATFLADEYGQYDDWIELFNAGPQPAYLGDLFLSDKLNVRDKWQLPDMTLQPGAYLLIWADGDNFQGPLHTNFRLDADGEAIGLFSSRAYGLAPIDTLTFPAQSTDVSFGRLPNGSGPFQVLPVPSPGANNETGTAVDQPGAAFSLRAYPNPFAHLVRIEWDQQAAQPADLAIYSLDGRRVWEEKNAFSPVQWQPEALPDGLYLLRMQVQAGPARGTSVAMRLVLLH